MKTDKLKKNTMQHPIILLLTAALLAGCGSKTNPTPTDAKIQWGKQDVAAVALVKAQLNLFINVPSGGQDN